MRTKFTKLLSLLLVSCLLLATAMPTLAADGTATLRASTMTESGSITVTFSQTATTAKYYNIQIADSSWNTTYVNTNITSGTTYTISGYSAGTYKIYIGYCENGSWKSDALSTTTFTVTADGATSYGLSLSISDSAPALGDSVTVTASFTVDGTSQTTIPDDCKLSMWYEHDSDCATPVNGSSSTTSTTISVSSANFTKGETYTVQAALYDSDWDTLASASVTFTPSGTSAGGATDTYAVSITPAADTCEQYQSITFTATVTYGGEEIDLPSQSDVYLWLWADSWADGHSAGLTDCTVTTNDGLQNSVSIYFPSAGTYYIAYTLTDAADDGNELLKSTSVSTITVTASTATPSEEITTGSISDCEFMRGMDLSTFYTNWTNGAVYYDYDGNEYSQSKGNAVEFFEFLYNTCGVDWVRLRVWNDPYDEDGNPYGGGNNDVATAAIIGKWASDAGMTLLIDFHYSDFWADPGRQLAPKAWEDMTIDEKSAALYTYTYESLEYLLDAGVNVGMVQVGNETNGAFCGEKITTWSNYDTNEDWQNIVTLFKSGSSAVRDISTEYGVSIKVALHFTNPNAGNPSWYCGLLADAGVDYDAIGISYYMYWHGTLANLASEISTIYNTYGKEVFIAETAYPYTDENYDDLGNQVTSYSDFDMNANLYAISEAGQEAALTAILDTAATTDGCIGMFYWEAAWTTINSDTYRDSGGGWATKWASDYISYSMSASEGSSFENQALFNNNGNALPALKFFADYVSSETLPEHSWDGGGVTRLATASEDGIIVYTCSACGETKVVTYSLGEYASFYTRTLTLDGDIGVNYYVNMYELDADEMAKYTVVFTVDGTEYTAEFDANSYRSDFVAGTNFYRFSVALNSTQMATTFTAKLIYDGTLTVQTNTYSVESYCKYAITNSLTEKALCAALLNYGGYSQTYCNVDTGNLANANLSDYDSDWSDPVKETFEADLSSYTTTISDTIPSEITGSFSASLVLESQTVIRIYFNATSTDNLTFAVGEETLKIQTATGDYAYYVEYEVQASKLGTAIEFSVSNGSTTGTVSYSAYAYINTQLSDGDTSAALANVCKALYYYGEAARTYTGWYKGNT